MKHPSLLPLDYWGGALCPSSGHSIMLTTHLPLLPRLRMAIAVSPLPLRVHSMHRDFASLTESLKETVFMIHVQVRQKKVK